MSKKHPKMYPITVNIERNNTPLQHTSNINHRNHLHITMLERCKCSVVESKKRKPPKYKYKIYEEE